MARINSVDPRAPNLNPNALRVAGVQIVEADGTAAGTYTKDITIPAYACVVDVIVHNEALWDAGTDAVIDVGLFTTAGVEIDADYYFSALSLKATDLLATQSISFSFLGGDNGAAFGTATHVLNRVESSARLLRTKVTTTGTAGTAGLTYVYVIYALPEMDPATFVAT